MLSDASFRRYHRQIMLPEIGEAGQGSLEKAKVLVVGLGGLGSPVCLYLVAAGVGSMVIADDDTLDSSNLQRQVLYREIDVEDKKVQAAADNLKQLNPHCRIRTIDKLLDGIQLQLEAELADLVLDCSDNLATRYAVNQACARSGTPLISGAATGWQGQLMSFDFTEQQAPCYQCLFPRTDDQQPVMNCRTSGIVGPVVGAIGTLQALQAIKFLTGAASIDSGSLRQFDGLSLEWQRLSIPHDPRCPICSKEHSNE